MQGMHNMIIASTYIGFTKMVIFTNPLPLLLLSQPYFMATRLSNKSLFTNSHYYVLFSKSWKKTKENSIPLTYKGSLNHIKMCFNNTRDSLPFETYNILSSWFLVLPCSIFFHITPPLKKVQ